MKDIIYKHLETGKQISAFKDYRKWWKEVWSEQAEKGEKFPYSRQEVLEEAIKFYENHEDNVGVYERVKVIN